MTVLSDARLLVPERWRIRIADLRGRGIYAGYPNRYRCIFIHIPKTAGSSIASALFGETSRHVPYFEFQRANPRKFRTYLKFTFVRNPWDRLVSTYFFLRGGGMNEQDRRWSEKHLRGYRTFDEFVRGWVTQANIATWVHFLPQSDFVLNRRGKLMVDFVGRYERLHDDFRHVAQRLGQDVHLPTINKSRHQHFTSYYTDDTQDIVRRVYARDVQAFGYMFQPS